MIISCAERTDIPAFYSEWFMNRLREGFVLVRNPFNPMQVTRYILDPSVVDILAFCTKNPEPLLSHMDELSEYRQFWYVTITGYGKDMEPGVPPKENVIKSFQKLSQAVGSRAVGWRYDPILITEKYSVPWHIRTFKEMAEKLSGYTHYVVISFLDLYANVRRNFPEGKAVSSEEQRILARKIVCIASEYGMKVRSCGEGDWMAPYGVDTTGCYGKKVLEEALDIQLKFPKMSTRMRSECTCYLGGDIGAYSTCGHFCRYCYANKSREAVMRRMREHDPHSPFLTGHSEPGDRIHQADQKSWIERQMTLDFGC